MQAFSDLDVCATPSNFCISYENFSERQKDCDYDLTMGGLPSKFTKRSSHLKTNAFKNNLGKKNMLVNSIYFFSHDVFYLYIGRFCNLIIVNLDG